MAGRLNEEIIFTRHYASLCNTLTDVDHLLPYFVQENIINTNDVESLDATTIANKVKKLLSHISGPLIAEDTKGFHVMLNIMKEHGNLGTKNLAVKISRELPSTISEIEDDGMASYIHHIHMHVHTIYLHCYITTVVFIYVSHLCIIISLI